MTIRRAEVERENARLLARFSRVLAISLIGSVAWGICWESLMRPMHR
jgi:hypothetical protein